MCKETVVFMAYFNYPMNGMAMLSTGRGANSFSFAYHVVGDPI